MLPATNIIQQKQGRNDINWVVANVTVWDAANCFKSSSRLVVKTSTPPVINGSPVTSLAYKYLEGSGTTTDLWLDFAKTPAYPAVLTLGWGTPKNSLGYLTVTLPQGKKTYQLPLDMTAMYALDQPPAQTGGITTSAANHHSWILRSTCASGVSIMVVLKPGGGTA